MRFLWLVALLAGPFPANADDDANANRLLNDRFRLSIGGFYAESATHARLSTEGGGVGVDVSFEDALGLETRKWIGEASMYWRITNNWRLDVSYFSLKRHASRALAADISWGDHTFSAGTIVDSSFKISDTRAALGYSFFRRPNRELGIGVGVHSLSLDASIDARGTGLASGTTGTTSERATAPLPVVALYGNFALTDTWALSLRADWLSLAYAKYSGGIRSTAIDVVYQPFKHVAIGVGLHSLIAKLEVDNPHSQFAARVALQGPAAFMSVSF